MRSLVIVPAALTASHLEVLSAAHSLGDVAVVCLGDPDLEGLARHGVTTAYVPELSGRPLEPAVIAEAAAAVVRVARPDAVLLLSSFAGKAVAARLAVAFEGGAIADVTSLRVEDGRVIAGKSVLGGTWDTECTVTRGLAVIAVKPTALEIGETAPVAVDVIPVEVAFSAAADAVTRTGSEPHPRSGRPPLAEARVVVAGGRGVDGDFSLLEQLADELGGALGATRVATDEGWIDHSTLIGQTGTTIAPRLYLGAGVSGAVHHTAGMRSAEIVVAVNSDPEAPIFEIADFGVVGDLTEVLPQLLAALRSAGAQ